MDFGKEALEDLDVTLDALIANANALRTLEKRGALSEHAAELAKKQETLLETLLQKQQEKSKKERSKLYARSEEKELLLQEKKEHLEKINGALCCPLPLEKLRALKPQKRLLCLSKKRKRSFPV